MDLHLQFFHLNRLSAGTGIKVDFDLAMTVLAFNLYRLFARDLSPGFRRHPATTLFRKLFATGPTSPWRPGAAR